MKETHTPKDDGKVLGDINPRPGTKDTLPRSRKPGSEVDWDDEEGRNDLEKRTEHPAGSRDVGQSTEGTGGGSRNYRPAGTTGSDIGNRPE
jgi:hypothetical protein